MRYYLLNWRDETPYIRNRTTENTFALVEVELLYQEPGYYRIKIVKPLAVVGYWKFKIGDELSVNGDVYIDLGIAKHEGMRKLWRSKE